MGDERSPDHLPFFKVGNVATGFIAVGNVAYGFIAIGFSAAVGPIAIGLNAIGPIMAVGLNSVGLISLAAINAGGLFGLAGVNLFAGFGAAGVNAGASPYLGVVYGIVSLGASFAFPKGAPPLEQPAGVPEQRVTLDALMARNPQRGWIDARLERVEPGVIHVRAGRQRASLLVTADVERLMGEIARQAGSLPCDACFQVQVIDEPQVGRDADYRHGPEYRRELRCYHAVLLPTRPPWWARKSALHSVNRWGAIAGGAFAIATGIAGAVLS